MIIGLDVGGTHTDAVLVGKSGVVEKVKEATREYDLFATVVSALEKLLKGIDPETVQRVVLSTTLTTNAVVQKRVNPVGIIVSSGPGIDPELFRTSDYYYPVAGSIDHRGREREPIDKREIKTIGARLKKAGLTNIGIIGKFSPRNPRHELLIRELLEEDFKNIFLGHSVSGNLNFPRRIATVHLNAAVHDLHKHFFDAVKQSLAEMGLVVPIHVLKADGGTMSLEASMDFPGQTILSGPAASVIGSLYHAPADRDALVLDIGGTTTDIALLVNRAPLLEPVGIKRGIYKSLIRSLKTHSIGIGGDSRVRVVNNRLTIGPDRSGPAMAYGGTHPTPTDALVVLGLMDPPNRSNSLEGITALADQLGLSPVKTAETIFATTCREIIDQAGSMVEGINSKPVYTVHEFLEGYKIKPAKILLLGGPAEDFKEKIQTMSGIETAVVPESSVANAIGAALARTTCEVTLMADTEQGIASAPEEHFTQKITKSYTLNDAVETARNLLQKKAVQSGSDPENLEFEILENLEFNIVRGFAPKGKIFRIKIQIKPGLIKGYRSRANGK
ncbi:MAG TPA: hydantoinase/oxoprolinase family protein [Desulfobacteraceae bacterium]|nr:hydantoinase/oxoprolinase family protein [Desulfobacteraceae bacterium]